MNRQISLGAFFVLLMVAAWPFNTFADGAAVKCAPNEERAWLYDSVATLNVAAKLKCGENVEVLGQESGYVKVRTAGGMEGYLPANNLPKIPVPNAGATAAAPAQPEQPTLASLARAAAAARHAREAAAASTETASAPPVTAPSITAQPVVAANVASAGQPKIATPVAASPAKAAAAAPATVTPVSSTTGTPAAPVVASAHTTSMSSSSSRTKSKPASKSSTTTVTSSAKPGSANPPAPRPAPAANANAPVHTAVATPGPRMPNAQSAQPASSNDIYVTSVVNASAAPNSAMVRTVANTSEDDDDDSYLTKPTSESDDPACQTYISGYGLSPGQFKWLADNRKKKYPSICPAASPAMVDYVMIFTHDVDFFNYTMPTPVHTEAGGFSDWTPMLEFDTSVISHSDIDKSRHEYVWVFHVKRGAFDPAKFSPHRRFQYTKVESKYAKTVEDALDYIQSQPANR